MNKKSMVRSVALGVIILTSMFSVLSFVEEVSAVTHVVDSSGGTPYQTIAQALSVAANGDTIQVNVGIGYTESNILNVDVTIQGSGISRPVVTAAAGTAPVFDIKTSGVTIDYLEIDGSGTSSKAGVRSDVTAAEHNNVQVSDCVIHDFTTSGYGVLIKRTNPAFAYPTGHLVVDCEIYNVNTGVHIVSDPDNQVTYPNNIVTQCDIHSIVVNGGGLMGDGIYNHGDKNSFTNNEISYCDNYGINMLSSYQCEILDTDVAGFPCDIHHNDVGIYLYDCLDNDIEGTDEDRLLIVRDNDAGGILLYYSNDNGLNYLEVDDNDGYGIYLEESDVNSIINSDITDNYYSEEIPVNYIYLVESCSNIIEDNILDATSSSSSIDIVVDSDLNIISENTLDGYIRINGDSNIVQDMEFYTLHIYEGEYNNISRCDITVDGGTTTDLINIREAHYTSIYYCNLDGIDDECTGIYVDDSTDVLINGYLSGSGYPEIDNCDILLQVVSDDYASDVYFHHYQLYDDSDVNDDIILSGISPNFSDVEWNNLNGVATMEIDEGAGCDWHNP